MIHVDNNMDCRAPYREKLEQLSKDMPYPSGEYRCPHCTTCLICFMQIHGKKLHSDECNYECGHCPKED